MAAMSTTGGSTNVVLHLVAIAHFMDVNRLLPVRLNRIPFLADPKSSGKYVMADMHKIVGTPALLEFLLKEGFTDGSINTVTGKILAENLEDFLGFLPDQDTIRPLSNPIKETGHIQILRGSLAPGGSVGKITGKEGRATIPRQGKNIRRRRCLHRPLERGEIKEGEKTL
jgi:dihydroxy-acid dehydratase